MVVILFLLCGACGVGLGLFISAAWFGASLLFGFPPPTPDQTGGLAMLLGAVGVLGSAAVAAVVVLVEG